MDAATAAAVRVGQHELQSIELELTTDQWRGRELDLTLASGEHAVRRLRLGLALQRHLGGHFELVHEPRQAPRRLAHQDAAQRRG